MRKIGVLKVDIKFPIRRFVAGMEASFSIFVLFGFDFHLRENLLSFRFEFFVSCSYNPVISVSKLSGNGFKNIYQVYIEKE